MKAANPSSRKRPTANATIRPETQGQDGRPGFAGSLRRNGVELVHTTAPPSAARVKIARAVGWPRDNPVTLAAMVRTCREAKNVRYPAKGAKKKSTGGGLVAVAAAS